METLLIADNVTHMVQRGFLAPIDVFALAHVSRRVRALVTALLLPYSRSVELVQSAYRNGSLGQIAWLRAQGVRGSETTVWCALLAGRERYRLLQPLLKHGLLSPLFGADVDGDVRQGALLCATDTRLVARMFEDMDLHGYLNITEMDLSDAAKRLLDENTFRCLLHHWGGCIMWLLGEALNEKDWPLAARLLTHEHACKCGAYYHQSSEDIAFACNDLEVTRFLLDTEDSSPWENDDDGRMIDCASRNYLNTVHMVLEMGAYVLTPERRARLSRESHLTPDMQRLLQKYERDR